MTSPQALYSLLIGIDFYLPNPWCKPLHGAVADARAMEALLLARGVPSENLITLTASPGHGTCPAEPPNRRPTYESMVRAIRGLGQTAAKAKGELLIHYSGHGCRTPTLIPATKGSEGLDEGWVPFDIADPQARILRDVELSHLLEELGEVPVVLTLDACHSGGILRGDAAVRVRSADTIDRPPSGGVAPVEILEASWRRAHRRAFASLDDGGTPEVSRGAVPWGRCLGPAVTLAAACRDREVAYEFPFDGEPRGALTYAMLEVLGEGDTSPSWERLQRRIAHVIRRAGLHQTPVFEGDPSGVLLGLLRRGACRTLRVLDIDPARGRVTLDSGRAAGLARGARVEILTGGGSESHSGTLLAEIEESGASAAWARALQGDLAAVEPGDQAFVTDPGTSSRRRVLVEPAPRSSDPGSTRGSCRRGSPSGRDVLRDGRFRGEVPGSPAQYLQEVEYELEKRSGGFLERMVTRPPTHLAAADFRITLNSRGGFEVLHPDGRQVPHLSPLPATSPESLGLLVDRLIHLARFYTVRDLENGDTRSPLYGAITAELGRIPRGFTLGDALEPEPCKTPLPRFAAGEGVCLTVTNRSPRTLHLYVLDLGHRWSVRLLHPRQGLETLPAGHKIRLPFMLSLAPGVEGGIEAFKVLATTKPTNVRWLELPSIDQPSLMDEISRETPDDPLERFLASVLRGIRPIRSSSSHEASKFWGTDQVPLELIKSRKA